MVLKFFCISVMLMLQLRIECFSKWKTKIGVNKYARRTNRSRANVNIVRVQKKVYNYKRFSVYMFDEDSLNNTNRNTCRNTLGNYFSNFYKKNYTIFVKTLECMGNAINYVKENLFMSSLKKQLIISISFFFLHFYLLSEHFLILFPYQLIPNHSNILMSLDLNNTLVLLSTIYFLKDFSKNLQNFKQKLKFNRFILDLQENKRKNILSIAVLLIASYILSGYVSIYTEKILSYTNIFNLSLSDSIIKSLQILSGHFIWVACSIVAFKKLLYPYFKNNNSNLNFRYEDSWCFKVIYGYMCSHFIFNIVDIFNNFIIRYFNKEEVYLDNSIDDIVNEREIISTILCIISPCFSAPFFEEFIYRFFVLKSLNSFMNIHYAVTFSSLFFAVHHLNIFNLIPLFFLSFFWSYIYIYTDNILVTMIIHSFWNIYVFLTSIYN
ncbi:protease, putative [Plasmodium malariae]|uniref:Protease, putative n=1 Tax=Plasmodium malariae TaxID=5858 RepID=A0A1C3KBH8_PLAMA|nr:protease, putative [Plasmodium malariae]